MKKKNEEESGTELVSQLLKAMHDVQQEQRQKNLRVSTLKKVYFDQLNVIRTHECSAGRLWTRINL